MKKLLFALLAIAVSPPLFAQESGTITSTQCVAIDVKVDKSTVGIQVTGTWTGTLQPQVSIQGQPAVNAQVVPSTSTTPQATITGNGVFYANVGGGGIFQVCGNTVASGTANIFLNGSKGVNSSTLGVGGGLAVFSPLNNTVWAGPSFPYTTFEGAAADSKCSGSCQLNLASGFAETFTSTLNFGRGSSNPRLQLHGLPGADMTCNVTNGTPCFNLNSESAIVAELPGANSQTSGGFLFHIPATANISCFICVTDQVNGASYVRLEKFLIYGNPAATVSGAVVDYTGVNNVGILRDFYVTDIPNNAIGFRLRPGTSANAFEGPLSVDNVWSDGFHNVGTIPCVISSAGNTVTAIGWHGGVCNHPGSAQPMMQIIGPANTNHSVRNIHIDSTYFENLANGNSIGVQIQDAAAVHLNSPQFFIQDTDTAVDIAQTGANRTMAIQMTNVYKSSPTNAAKMINNHITGFTSSALVAPFYSYGGDSGLGVMPFTIESNDVQILNGANQKVFSLKAQAGNYTSGPLGFLRTYTDAQGEFNYDCGATATQTCYWGISDRGTEEWGFGHDASNSLLISDRINFKTRISIPQSNVPALSGLLRAAASESAVGWRNNAGTGDVVLAKNTSDQLTFNTGLVTVQPCAATSQKSETAADANVLTCAIPALAGSYRIHLALSLSAATAATVGWTATWTDSNGNLQTPTNLSLVQSGAAAPALTFTTSVAGNYYGEANVDVNNAGTSIVVKLTFSGTSFAGKVSASVERLI